jgi:ABC-type phosphate/phosphonate transport system substrate-binding protein
VSFQLRILNTLLLLCLLPCFAFADPLILTAPPRETPEAGKAMYGPIAEYLSKVLQIPVEYKSAKKWNIYTKEMQEDKYDIVFDGPHFSAWRIKHYHHEAVAKLPGTLDFVVFTKKQNTKINNMHDLITKRICGMPSPNLATMTAFALYDNPVIQPQIYLVKKPTDVYKAFKEGKCDAAIMRKQFVMKKIPKEELEQIKIIAKANPMPNQTVTVSARLTAEQKEMIMASLTSPDGAHASEKLLSRFSKKKKFFEKAKTDEYAGIESLLEGVVWGW